MFRNFGRASRVLLSGLLASSLLFGLTTAAESQSPGGKGKKSEPPVFSNTSASPSPTRSTDGQSPKKGQFDEKLWSGMQWREVGPYRGGRAIAIEGVPGE